MAASMHMLTSNKQEFAFLHIVFILELLLGISHHDPVGCGEHRKKEKSSELVCNPSANWHGPSGDSWVAAPNPEINNEGPGNHAQMQTCTVTRMQAIHAEDIP